MRERAIEVRGRQVRERARERARELEERVRVRQVRERYREVRERYREGWERPSRQVTRTRMPRELSLLISHEQKIEQEIQMLEQEAQAITRETQKLEQEKQETQTLKMILLWIRSGGKKALKHAEFDLEKRSVKPTGIIQHIEQLLELMKEEYYLHTQLEPHGPGTPGPGPTRGMSASLRERVSRVFKEILEEIPKHGNSELRHCILEDRLSNALDKILRLSSWTPSSTVGDKPTA